MSGGGGSDKSGPYGVYQCKEMIHDLFLQTGDKDLLMAHIRHKTTQQGWTWAMREEFMAYIKKRGPENVNVSHMIADLARMGRDRFPADLKKELVESMFEMTKDYFTIDDTIPAITDPDNPNSDPENTFLYQSKDIKPDPGLGVGVEVAESPPPSPHSSTSTTSTPRQSPGHVSSNSGTGVTTRQSPVQTTPRQSPSSAPRHSPVSSTPRPLTPQQSLPPPPVLRPETSKSDPVLRSMSNEEEEMEEEDDEDDTRNDEEEEEDELLDV